MINLDAKNDLMMTKRDVQIFCRDSITKEYYL